MGLLDDIRGLINDFFDKTPRIVQLLMGLLLVAIVGILITFSLQLFGFHCNSDKVVMKISTINFPANLGMIFLDKTDEPLPNSLTQCEAETLVSKFMITCSQESTDICIKHIRQVDGDLWESCNMTNPPIDCIYGLRSIRATCNTTSIYLDSRSWTNRFTLCLNDANQVNLSWWETGYPDCAFPTHYYFSSTTGKYECLDMDYCGTNATAKPKTILDDKLASYGAVPYYQSTNENDINSAVLLTCNNDYTAQVTVYGIPIFDYQIWILMMVIVGLAKLLINLKQTH